MFSGREYAENKQKNAVIPPFMREAPQWTIGADDRHGNILQHQRVADYRIQTQLLRKNAPGSKFVDRGVHLGVVEIHHTDIVQHPACRNGGNQYDIDPAESVDEVVGGVKLIVQIFPERRAADKQSAQHKEYDDRLMAKPADEIKHLHQDILVHYKFVIDKQQVPEMFDYNQ